MDLIARLFSYLLLMFSFACLIVVNPPILVAMEVIRFLSGLCYSFPSSPSRSHCMPGMDDPEYKYARLSTLNQGCASTYVIHDVGIEYNGVKYVQYVLHTSFKYKGRDDTEGDALALWYVVV